MSENAGEEWVRFHFPYGKREGYKNGLMIERPLHRQSQVKEHVGENAAITCKPETAGFYWNSHKNPDRPRFCTVGKFVAALRSAATSAGIPAVTLELGEPGSLQKQQIKEGVKIIETLLSKLNMIKRHRGRTEPQPVYYSSRWVRVDNGGLLTTRVKVGARIKKGTIPGRIVNPLSNESYEVTSPYNGRLLGMALSQFMLPGYAAFNIGLVAEEPAIMLDTQTFECRGTGMDPEQVMEEFGCASEEGEEIESAGSLQEELAGAEESEQN